MKWSNVKLIFFRELKDQLRDRRTLFTVAILPLILYPLMGMALLQVAQFMREHKTTVWVVGAENLPEETPLISGGEFDQEWVGKEQARLLQLHVSEEGDEAFQKLIDDFRLISKNKNAARITEQLIEREMKARNVDLAVFVPNPQSLEMTAPDRGPPGEVISKLAMPSTPKIYIFQNSASDKSNIGAQRFNAVLAKWQEGIARQTLEANGLAPSIMNPISIQSADVANKTGKRAAAWSKILPFIIMIWSLTGAFYPAVDLVAGEKERGTFETLLSSPAHRSEIAIGKLLTVMSFSMVTSLLNLLSMGITGLFIMSRLGSTGLGAGIPIGMPPLGAIGWLLLALIPISALFSAVALAAAAFARSSKEGQYYLVPLLMISMPLMMVPMLPAAKLDLGTSLIPVSGLMLLLRGLIEGQYTESLQFAGPACAVTLICCWLAIRWVVRQFNSETVLFRASERFGVGSWLKHVMHQRDDLPSVGTAILCGLMILFIQFFMGPSMQAPTSWFQFSKQTVIFLVASIAMPAVLMALVMTRNPRKSLLFSWCSLPSACAAILLALCLHPLILQFSGLVMQLYPLPGEMTGLQKLVSSILDDSPSFLASLLVIAVAPAIFEEIAFRGFILSGMRSLKKNWQAILFTSLLFGAAHGAIQQSIITFVVGMILGVIAVQTRSIIPCILYHATHNSLTASLSLVKTDTVNTYPMLSWLLESSDGTAYQYSLIPAILMSIGAVLLLVWFFQLRQIDEEHKKPFELSKVVTGLLAARSKKQQRSKPQS